MDGRLLRYSHAIEIVQAAAAPMASKEALSRLDAQLECAVCLERYVDPRTLPCLHSFCKNCVGRLPVVTGGLSGQHRMLKCPACRKHVRLEDEGVAALPTAFHINNLLDIIDLFKKTRHHFQQVCHVHERPKDLYCDTCEELVCFKCSTSHHNRHQCDCAENLFTKHKQQIEACLEPMKNKIDSVEENLGHFDAMEREMKAQANAMLEEINDTHQKIVTRLDKSRRKLAKDLSAALEDKLQLHSMERAKVESVLTQLRSCHELVSEGLRTRSPYQIQAAKKEFVKRINQTHSAVTLSMLQPAQRLNTKFTADTNALSACEHIGDISDELSFSFPGLLSVTIPHCILECKPVEVFVSCLISISANRLTCQFTPIQAVVGGRPVVCLFTDAGEGQFCIKIQSNTSGQHQLRIAVDGMDVYGSPFTVAVSMWRRTDFTTFVDGLRGPSGVAITGDGQHVLVTEFDKSEIALITNAGRLKEWSNKSLQNPCGVAVSPDDKHIFVASINGMLHKFTMPSSAARPVCVASVNLKGFGVAVHAPSRKIFVTNIEKAKIEVLNNDLTHSHSFGGRPMLQRPLDLALDTKGLVYVTDWHKRVILKFTPEGEHLASIGNVGEKFQQLACPFGICIDRNDILYVTDAQKHQVLVYSTEGEFLSNLDNDFRRGIDLDNHFHPRGIAVDNIGNVYVSNVDRGELLVST